MKHFPCFPLRWWFLVSHFCIYHVSWYSERERSSYAFLSFTTQFSRRIHFLVICSWNLCQIKQTVANTHISFWVLCCIPLFPMALFFRLVPCCLSYLSCEVYSEATQLDSSSFFSLLKISVAIWRSSEVPYKFWGCLPFLYTLLLLYELHQICTINRIRKYLQKTNLTLV